MLITSSILEKFHDLRWIPTEPELLDYPNAQFLIIGAAQDELGKAAVAKNGSKDDDQEQPGEELEKFEDENEERVKSLKGSYYYLLLVKNRLDLPDFLKTSLMPFHF